MCVPTCSHQLLIWDVESGVLHQRIQLGELPVFAVSWGVHGFLATASQDGQIHVLSADGQVCIKMRSPDQVPVTSPRRHPVPSPPHHPVLTRAARFMTSVSPSPLSGIQPTVLFSPPHVPTASYGCGGSNCVLMADRLGS